MQQQGSADPDGKSFHRSNDGRIAHHQGFDKSQTRRGLRILIRSAGAEIIEIIAGGKNTTVTAEHNGMHAGICRCFAHTFGQRPVHIASQCVFFVRPADHQVGHTWLILGDDHDECLHELNFGNGISATILLQKAKCVIDSDTRIHSAVTNSAQ